MNKYLKYCLLVMLSLFSQRIFAQLKLGNNVNSINVSSLLELESTTKGLLFSRMNTAQMTALTAVNGLTIYNTDSSCLCTYNSAGWVSLCATTSIPNLILTTNNNMRSIRLGNGNVISFSVADGDSSILNEIQTLFFANDTLYLSKNGGKVALNGLRVDTTSLSARIERNKQSIIDTATSLRANINTRVKYIDTAAMLSTYANKADNGLTKTGQKVQLGGSLTKPTTVTTTSTNTLALGGLQSGSKTDSLLVADPSTGVIKRISTANLQNGFMKLTDTASLSSRINTNKQAIIDTATSLRANINTRVKYTDTAAMLSTYANKADNGLTKTGQKVQLGGSLTKPTTITTTSTNTLALGGLQSGSKTDSLLVADPSTGVIKRISTANLQNGFMKLTDTASLSSRINKNKQAIIDTATSLRANINTRVKYTDTAAMLTPYIYSADNGLTKTGKKVQLGGSLTKPTTITTTSTNTLALGGLQSGSKTDSLLVADPSTGVIKRISTANLQNGFMKLTDTASLSSRINKNKQAIIDTATSLRANINTRVKYTDTAAMLSTYANKADNGLTKTGQKVQLGGSLTKPTTVTTTSTNTLALGGLQSGSKTDSLLVADPSTGVIKRISTANLQNGFMKLTDTASLSSRINKNKQAIIDTATSLRANINTRVKYTDTAAMLTPYIYSADNGLTKTGKKVQLGGSLTKPTTVTTTSTNTLALGGLQSGSKTDSLLVADPSTGVIKRISTANLQNGFMKLTDTASLSSRINARVKYSDTAAMLSTYANKADNGLTKTGQKVQLGGSLTKPTTVTTTSTNTLALGGLQSGSKTDSLLVADPSTGVIKRISTANLQNGFMKLTDTASLSSRINRNKQAIIDTATSLRANINTRVKYSDTATMLSTYANKADNGLTKTGQKVQLGGSLTKPTTVTTTSTNTLALGGLQSGSKTDSLLVADPSTGVIKRISTANLQNGFMKLTDTASLSSRINKNKQAIIDTATSLRANINTRVKYTDTAAMLTPYIYSADNGLTKTGKKVQLGGSLTKPTTITTTSTNTLALGGLQSGSKTDSLLVADPSTGVIKRISTANLQNGFMKLTDTASLSSRINQRMKYSDTVSLSNRINARVKYTDTAAMLTPYIYSADNGLTKTGKKVQLGGSLTKPTTVTTTSTNTLALGGLQSGSKTDSLLVADPSTGVIKRISTANLQNGFMKLTDTASLSSRINQRMKYSDTVSLSNRINARVKYTDTAAMLTPYIYSADNGLTKTGKKVQLGGSLTQATTITTTSTNTLALGGLQSGSKTDSLLVANPSTGVIKRISTTNLLSGYMKLTDTVSLSNRINQRMKYSDTVSLSSRINQRMKYSDTVSLSNRINQRMKYSDTVSLSNRINARVKYTDTAAMLTPYIYSADNGLTKTGKKVQLGGSLTQATTITTTSTNTLALGGLQSGAKTDSLLVASPSSGVIKRISTANLLSGYMKLTDTTSLSSRINQRMKYSDTVSLSSRINQRMKYSDTVSLSNRINQRMKYSDTVSLSNRINQRMKYSDTVSLSNRINARVKYTDTAAMLTPYIYSADNGLTKTGKKVQLGGSLTKPTTVTTTSTNTLALGGLQSGSKTDSLLVADPSTGVIKRISTANLQNGYMKLTDTVSLSNRINQRMKYSDTVSLSSRINKNKQAIIDTATSLRANINTRVKYTDTASMLTPYLRGADNGVTKNGRKVQLGGSLTQATTITTTSTNTLALGGLQSGAKTDSLLVASPSSGVIKRISTANLLSGYMKLTDTVSLSNRINQRMKYSDTVSLSNRINQRMKYSDTVSLSNRINQRVKYTDTASMLSPYIRMADNGITKTGQKVQLGGSLTKATTITTTSTNTLALSGLQGGLRTDSIMVIDPSTSVVKKRSAFTNVITLTGNYTVSVSDQGSVITINSSSATTLTIPSGLPVGFNISIYQIGTGKTTIAGASGVTLKNRQSRFKTAGKDAGVGLVITASNVAHLTGDLSK